jgi:aryl-alcohol dehydrogenase-like predicted oxidoreductase
VEPNNRLVLGTAQLGMSYGIANKTGLPDLATATAIVQTAWESGICEFDTAQAYGKSEQVLSQALSELGVLQEARVINKLDPSLNHSDKRVLSQALEQSLNRFKVSSFYGLMLHREGFMDLLEHGLTKTLLSFIQDEKVRHIGISAYSPEKALQALQYDTIDMVQVPSNVVDQRFHNAGLFELAEQRGKRIYIRSVFLQGLLLMKLEELPPNMDFARPVLKALEQLSREFAMTRQEMALGYVKLRFPNARVIFGAETPEQVKSNVASWATEPPESFLRKVDEIFSNVDKRAINPTLWPN